MRDNINATDKINDIRLSLCSDMGSKIVWILVEGNDDCKIYPKFFIEYSARVEFVNGKGQLLVALETLTQETKQVIGIQDADFSHLDKNYPSITNLFFTDYHDIEMTMLSFEKVRNNLFTEYQMSINSQAIWENILHESSYVAYIRWYNEEHSKGINFKGIGWGRFSAITNATLNINQQDLLDELKNLTNNNLDLKIEDIDNYINLKKTNDLFNLCNGHDVTALFAQLVRWHFVNILHRRTDVSHDGVCSDLRLSFTLQEFSTTKLYSEINSWQEKNGFAILK